LFCLIAGRALEDGKGSLADGTQFDRQSGEEHGPNGYWFRWHRLKGKSGKVSSSKAHNDNDRDDGDDDMIILIIILLILIPTLTLTLTLILILILTLVLVLVLP